ncbi:hypothetical protein [Desulfonema magnum]|uniref:Uncharacterized protein n=1 Tax=Desulfonema magnum TaxID=45655 RepID=A0A975GV69_9BACT|nr:hypothetical protein [Desulfonema magnum]QTA93373.1 Uncharacterized protein dnm_094740 [Desulfonema magnum]
MEFSHLVGIRKGVRKWNFRIWRTAKIPPGGSIFALPFAGDLHRGVRKWSRQAEFSHFLGIRKGVRKWSRQAEFSHLENRKNSAWRLHFCTPFCRGFTQGIAEMEPPGAF